MVFRRRVALLLLALVVSAGALFLRRTAPAVPEPLPSALTDEAFWRIVSEFSEPGGAFESENFVSNERSFQRVIPELEARLPRGGVYVGVGPEQNFTVLVALRPKLAFIVDIRRGNLLEHLFYKALVETSSDRAEFLSKLFGRPRPQGLAAGAAPSALFAAYRAAPRSEDLRRRTLEAAKDRLRKDHGFALTPDDLGGLDSVSDAFYRAGPDLDYTFPRGRLGADPSPTYADLMTETDGRGAARSFLATEEDFRVLADLERRNAIVPIVGDFAGPKALRAIGRYVADHGATVTALYASNVEVFLFRTDAWKRFYASVATFPIDARSTLVRSVANRRFAAEEAAPAPGLSMRLCSIADLVAAFERGAIEGYYDVITISPERLP